ncbi:MAG TPA: hypothetical protein DIV86_03210 [Alphaproteobacteria bacterium]|nr:hypothetical protein [Alphaproteobacteria bacterium]
MLELNKNYIAEIIHFLKRSFTHGDSNLVAQLYLARHYFLFGNKSGAYEIFERLKSTPMHPDARKETKGIVRDTNGSKVQYKGTITILHDNYTYINCVELGSKIFAHFSKFEKFLWDKIKVGDMVFFNLGFTMTGPQAVDIKLTQRN